MKNLSHMTVMKRLGLLLLASLLIFSLLGLGLHVVLHHHGESEDHGETHCPLCVLLHTLVFIVCASLSLPPVRAMRRTFPRTVANRHQTALRAHPLRGPPFAHQF